MAETKAEAPSPGLPGVTVDPATGVAAIKLRYPVTVAGVKVEGMRMRRPKVLDRLSAEKLGGSDGEREVALFASLCEVTPETLRDLDLADYTTLQRVFGGFLT